jgi:hypothetical protein
LTIHQCPKCELRFDHKTELDDHCWHDHPQFRHDYPAVVLPEEVPDEVPPGAPPPHHDHVPLGESLMRWVAPRRRHE